MKTVANFTLSGKQKYVKTIREMKDYTEIVGKEKEQLKSRFSKRIYNLIEYHNSVSKGEATSSDISMFKTSYCMLSIDVVVKT